MASTNGTINGTTDSTGLASEQDAKATEILKIIESYGLNYERTGTWEGFATFLPVVKGQVERKESIKMLLPGFPFKSPNNKTKVLGVLPDLGEELALKRLDGIATAIDAVYEHGVEIHITSDGLVYNDLLGVTDETVWNFGQAVREMADANGLKHLSFLRLWDLLGNTGDFKSKEYYLAHAEAIRQELKQRFGDAQFEADMANKSTADMHLTHTKYLEFLEQDLRYNEKHVALSEEDKKTNMANTAKEMMGRWKAFSAALASVPTDYVRLSIHDSGGSDKLSMALIPQREKGALGATPWHSTLVVESDGTFTQLQRYKVDQDKYELVERYERPYFWRTKGGPQEVETAMGLLKLY
ncbi:Pyoverdine/dityrosine biosynthesis protein-domain-containing protein [Paraphoma chrysanthemicola]|uniref:Pyoverdine/dityrosine biosynthesis protein-domain-containing protein n=1 Tax=Paraphoma chrysanthemicola TaxID=798071 RepID=A0A8K0VY32_9PLEO|nr:Pyoverdine/dityrosine biosynthesis protein-domain-containing protein [Paraphoma chrysanthemicola]